MKKLMLLVAMMSMVVMVAATSPAMAQQDKAAKAEAKAAKAAAKAEAKAAKANAKAGAKAEDKKMEQMPKTGGAPVSAALLGLGGATLLVGGGLLVRRVTR
jgi:hypothetical protein